MKCDVCEQDGLSRWKKLLMSIGLPMKCSNCDSRYKLGVFTEELSAPIAALLEFIFHFIVVFAYIPFILFFFWLVKILSWPVALTVCVITLAVVILLTPYRIDLKDPVNDIIARIQAKKTKDPTNQPKHARHDNES